jgi:hypothetical protein
MSTLVRDGLLAEAHGLLEQIKQDTRNVPSTDRQQMAQLILAVCVLAEVVDALRADLSSTLRELSR